MKKTMSVTVIVLGMLGLVCMAYAVTSERFAHDFWAPRYHDKRLAYCTSDKSACGKVVADRYCQELGYDEARRVSIAHNVGVASYLDVDKCCVGWQCAGFKMITCTAQTLHTPKRDYYYRSKAFVVPRFNHYRVDWCYADGQGCGKRAATSFCRRLGYAKAQDFKPEKNVAATRAIGDQRLCFGKDCQGFSSITCYR